MHVPLLIEIMLQNGDLIFFLNLSFIMRFKYGFSINHNITTLQYAQYSALYQIKSLMILY